MDAQQQALAQLAYHKQEFSRQLVFGETRQHRIEKLMARRKRAKMKPEKRARMIRRHHAALTQADQARTLLGQVDAKYAELTRTSQP